MGVSEFMIMGIFDIVNYILLSKKFFNEKKINKKLCVFFTILIPVLMGIVKSNLISPYTILIASFLCIIMIAFLYERGMMLSIYVYILSTILIIVMQLMVTSVFIGLGQTIEYNFINGLMIQTVTLLLILIISTYLPLHIILKYFYEDNKVIKYLIFNLFVIIISVWLYWNNDMEGILKNIINIATLSAGIIYVNLVFLREGLKNQQAEQQQKIYEDYLPIIDNLMDEIRARQHEFDNHIQALRMAMITNDDKESIVAVRKYMEELESNNQLNKLAKLNNKVLAGFLYSKINEAKKQGIDFQVRIEDYGFQLELQDYELVEMIGNLINNAFESNINNNYVFLKFEIEEDTNVIEVGNRHPYLNLEQINKMFKAGYSTKSRTGRGYGLFNVKQTVKKYQGNIQVLNQLENEENYLVFRISFARN